MPPDTVSRVLGSQPGCRITHEDGIVLTTAPNSPSGSPASRRRASTASPWTSRRADPRYLHKGVAGELPIRYRVAAQRAHDDDQTTDAGKAWPSDREWGELGTLDITAPDPDAEGDGTVLVFDPMRLTDGIESSDDPILHIRTHVYSESVRRRTRG